MTNTKGNDDKRSGEMDSVGQLINYAGAREGIQAETMNAARRNVTAHWENVVATQQGRGGRRITHWYALAASLIVVTGAALLLAQLRTTPEVILTASVDHILGDVFIDDVALRPGDKIPADARIETDAESRIAVRMANGQSLRIDTSSELFFHSPEHVSLQSGAVYIDSDGAPEHLPILISTSIASVQDVGTQFQVRLLNATLIVGVREGSVEIAQQGQASRAIDHGRFIELSPMSQGEERLLQHDDPSWEWIKTLAPDSAAPKSTLEQFLRRYADELGVRLRWTDIVSEENARKIEISGLDEDATPSESLEIVHAIADFKIRTDNESIWATVE